jgi:small subunit ribosomal protein S8
MSMTDPIADMLTRVRNAQRAGKAIVSMPLSRGKQAIAKLLVDEGYVAGIQVVEEEGKGTLVLELKYFEGRPVIEHLARVSRPGLRIYRSAKDLPVVLGGLGVAIVSTSKGLMTDRAARATGMGGEVVCTVY